MPRSKSKPGDTGAADARRHSTANLFAPRKPKAAPELTSERIADDMAAFRKGGGRIEVLGTTRVLKHIQPDDDASPPPRQMRVPGKSRA